ncbi:hypothetical protein GWK47_017520 [Chionoecetes opilio]|uniref:Uncharacterized protein n=1 Tax=Chionoecetes opilio TaxID=41210 RepID=A0A8J4XQX0_CHIOP|nr:hypothetical protein GWK47_017520 [Chionoecetes opilio]
MYDEVIDELSSPRRQDSDDETEEEEDEEKEDSYIQRKQKGSGIPLLHPTDMPSTTAIRVQPSAIHMHRPDLQDFSQDDSDSDERSLHSPNPSQRETTSLCSTSSGFSSHSNNLFSAHRSQNTSSQLHPPTAHLAVSATVSTTSVKVVMVATVIVKKDKKRLGEEKFPSKAKSVWAHGGGSYIRSLFGLEEPVSYAGQYTLVGSSKPIKLRSPNTLRAISSYQGSAGTRNSPMWYSFGKLELAVRYHHNTNMLDVKVMQLTHLPPGKEHIKLDLQVRVMPVKREKWLAITPGEGHQGEDNPNTSCSLKSLFHIYKQIKKLSDKRLGVSGFVLGSRSHTHLALGHGLLPDLDAQLLDDRWQSFMLPLRKGTQVQDHLGTALVALSCCERVHGTLTFTVDTLHLRNIKVLRLGSKVVSSFKTQVTVFVRAKVITEGCRVREKELCCMPLERPKDSKEHGWEAVFKRNCSLTFSVPKAKVHASCVVLEMHGQARQTVRSAKSCWAKLFLDRRNSLVGKIVADLCLAWSVLVCLETRWMPDSHTGALL